MSNPLGILRKITPSWAFQAYHRALSWLAAAMYRHPSRELIVIGVTGTNGKSSTCYFLGKALEAAGAKTGITTTALFKVADREWINATKMTMLGRFQLQKLLRNMVNAGCAYAVVETSSQGILQNRHKEIAYDACVFTNLTPEHIEAHGGFESYKRAKIQLFTHTASLPRKVIKGVQIPRVAILNADDEHADDFAVDGFDRTIRYGTNPKADVQVSRIEDAFDHSSFYVGDIAFRINTPGRVMVMNALAAIATADAFDLDRASVAERLKKVHGIPGRYEFIREGQPWHVMVDYAYEPAALGHLFDYVDRFKGTGRIIHLTGSAGGGRDVARRVVIGQLSAKRADITIVTNEDPYDDNPETIINTIADAAIKEGKQEGTTLYRILDRAEAVKKAMELAKPGDIVLLTGKGCEPVMAVANGAKVPWDDRAVAREAIRGNL